jgi:hypothetical protein
VLGVKVQDPQGQTWRVTRRWVPWRRKLKGSMDALPNFPTLGDDPISAIIGIVLLIVFLPIILLVLVAGLEFLVLLLILPFAVLGRALFGQHWSIEARHGWTPVWEEAAGNWSQSGQAIRDVCTAIERGHLPPTTLPQD